MTNVSHAYKSYLTSADLNQRFADFSGGSVLSGYRLTVGTRPDTVSLLRSGDEEQVLLTNKGVRVRETGDLIDIVQIESNLTELERTDVLYANYHHGEAEALVTYSIVKGVPGEEPEVYWTSTTRTPIGFVRVVPGEATLTADDLRSLPKGLTIHDLVFRKALELPNGLIAGPVSATTLTIAGKIAATEEHVAERETATRRYTDEQVAALVDSSPELLNTLDEIARALGDDPEFATTMTNELAKKVELTVFNAHAADTGIHVREGERETWHAKETPDGAQAKANVAEAQAKAHADTLTTNTIGGAPDTLDTLKKLADAIANNPNFATELDAFIRKKLDATHAADDTRHLNEGEREAWHAKETPEGAQTKVDTATAAIRSEYDVADGRAGLDATGKLKTEQLTAHTHPIEQVEGLSDALTGKSNTNHVHALATDLTDGFMSKANYQKLSSVEQNANNYLHPTTDGSLHVPATGTTNHRKFLMAGIAAGEITWQDILFGDIKEKPTTLSGYGITDGVKHDAAVVKGTESLRLEAADADHTYIAFYRDSMNRDIRSGYFGYTWAGSNSLMFVNELPGDFLFETGPGGWFFLNGKAVMTDAEVGKPVDLRTSDKTNVVAAVNELVGHTENLGLHMTQAERTQFDKIRFAEFDDLSVLSTDRDATAKVFRRIEYKRPDGTVYLVSTLSQPDTENRYTRASLEYRGTNGITVEDTVEWSLTYDAEGNITHKQVLQS